MIRTSTLTSVLAGWLLAAPDPAAALSINEVLYDAQGTDDGRVFVELYGTPGTVLDGWSIEGINGSDGSVTTQLLLAGMVPDDGFFVVADQSAGTTEVLGADLLLNFDFQNGPDSIVLRDAAGGVVDALGYGAFAGSKPISDNGGTIIEGFPQKSIYIDASVRILALLLMGRRGGYDKTSRLVNFGAKKK